MFKDKHLMVMGIVLMLAGCSTFRSPTLSENNGRDPSMIELNRVANKAEVNTQILAEIQSKIKITSKFSNTSKPKKINATVEHNWDAETNIDFEGQFNLIISKITAAANYQYYEIGNKPNVMPSVIVHAKKQSLKMILNNIIKQLPQTIHIEVYPKTQSVVVSYHEGA